MKECVCFVSLIELCFLRLLQFCSYQSLSMWYVSSLVLAQHQLLERFSFVLLPCCRVNILFMVALRNRADHYIFILSFVLSSSSSSSFSSLNLSGRRLMSARLPYFHTWRGFSANLGCRSETCCTRLAETQDAKNRHLGTIAQLCPAVSSQRYLLMSICLYFYLILLSVYMFRFRFSLFLTWYSYVIIHSVSLRFVNLY